MLLTLAEFTNLYNWGTTWTPLVFQALSIIQVHRDVVSEMIFMNQYGVLEDSEIQRTIFLLPD